MSPNHEFSVFFTAVTLKIRARSPKSVFCYVYVPIYIHENLVRIPPLFHKILYTQESVMPKPMTMLMPSRYAPKSICPSVCRLRDIMISKTVKYHIYKYWDTSTPYNSCSKIWKSTIYYPMLCLKIAKWVANSVDPDEMPCSAASHLGLHCLLRPVCPNTYCKYDTTVSCVTFRRS